MKYRVLYIETVIVYRRVEGGPKITIGVRMDMSMFLSNNLIIYDKNK